jgi:hypothetical protein
MIPIQFHNRLRLPVIGATLFRFVNPDGFAAS